MKGWRSAAKLDRISSAFLDNIGPED